MTSDLLDANMWLALEVSGHVHRKFAEDWFIARGETQCAFCRVTQMAFLRHLTNSVIMGKDVFNPDGAWAAYREVRIRRGVGWLPEPTGIDQSWELLCRRGGKKGSWWTDAYLAAFAIGHDIRLVTFDSDYERFVPDGLKLLVLKGTA